MQPMKEYMLRLAKCKTKLKRTLNRAEGGQYIYIYIYTYIYYLLINIFIALHNVSVYKPNNLVIIYYNQMWNLNVRNQVCYRVYSVCDQKYPFSSLCGQSLRIFRGQWCANQFERVRVKLMLAELMPLPVESGSTETNRSADIWTPPTPAADKIEKLYLNRGTDDMPLFRTFEFSVVIGNLKFAVLVHKKTKERHISCNNFSYSISCEIVFQIHPLCRLFGLPYCGRKK